VAWGHTSIKLSDGTYISWWPREPVEPNIKEVVKYRPAYRNRTYDDDVAGEGQKPPDYILIIKGLNQKFIRNWWISFHKDKSNKWSLDCNCSTVVKMALKAGGASIYWSFWVDIGVWYPYDILKWVVEIQNRVG